MELPYTQEILSRFDTIPECDRRKDRRTDRQTNRQNCYIIIALQHCWRAIITS